MDLLREFKNIEDYLIPKLKLDPIERSLYYCLLRHTRVVGKEKSVFGILTLSKKSGISEPTVRERIRILNEKGCIKIETRTREGHLVRVLLPEEIGGVVPRPSESVTLSIGEIDFYTNRTYVKALVERENGQCFYCLRKIDDKTCSLDHVVAQAEGIDHSFRNVVACCHDCNSKKTAQDAGEFLRLNYRGGLLSALNLQERLATLKKLQLGELVPRI